MRDSDQMAERVQAEIAVEDLESQLEDALVRAENAEEKVSAAEDMEAVLYRIAKYASVNKYGNWSGNVAIKVLRLHGLRTPEVE